MRKVFLDKLPIWKKGKNKGGINWRESIGYKVRFQYDDINGELEIVDYEKNTVTIKYINDTKLIHTGKLKECKISDLIGKRKKQKQSESLKEKYLLGDIISGKLKIIGEIVKNSRRHLCYECLHCGNIDEILPSNLNKNQGCNVCAGKKVLNGFNDLWTTRQDVAKFLKFPEHGHKVLSGSSKEDIFKCPECGDEVSRRIKNVCKNGYYCLKCGDGISYPEKFMSNFLDQMNIDYERQIGFEWSNRKIYDFFIPSLNCIIETHGKQHSISDFAQLGGRTLEEEKENDILKESFAKTNRIEKYITIDCRKSELEYIKNNIIFSELSNLFDLSVIDWNKCHEFACNSLVKITCDLWNSGVKSTIKISEIIKVSDVTVAKYLKQGVGLCWCDYDPKEVRVRIGKLQGGYNKKQIVQLTLDYSFVETWNSLSEAANNTNFHLNAISRACMGKLKTSGGFKWMYKTDYDKYISQVHQ